MTECRGNSDPRQSDYRKIRTIDWNFENKVFRVRFYAGLDALLYNIFDRLIRVTDCVDNVKLNDSYSYMSAF